MIGGRTEDAETRGLAPFWETFIHIETFNSGFRDCRIIFPYDSTLLDADRIVLRGRVTRFTPYLFSAIVAGANVCFGDVRSTHGETKPI